MRVELEDLTTGRYKVVLFLTRQDLAGLVAGLQQLAGTSPGTQLASARPDPQAVRGVIEVGFVRATEGDAGVFAMPPAMR